MEGKSIVSMRRLLRPGFSYGESLTCKSDHDTLSSMPTRESQEHAKIERLCEVILTSLSRDVWSLVEP